MEGTDSGRTRLYGPVGTRALRADSTTGLGLEHTDYRMLNNANAAKSKANPGPKNLPKIELSCWRVMSGLAKLGT
jgi:hypothetical protein